ncbi:MAG: hypothetical protein EYC69_11815 [Bacteroidetes bacterium]|nr:MAG: hypothetical protein EYC69_11815 [Bacteroidota bacterium]
MKKIISLILSILILTSNVGMSFSTHVCGGKVFKRSLIFSSAELPGCGMESGDKSSCPNNKGSFQKKCCEDKVTNYAVDDTYKVPPAEKSLNPEFTSFFVLVFNNLLNTQSVVASHHTLKEAPPLKSDIVILIQSFLI